MGKGILIIFKTAIMIAIAALAILGCLYVLEVFEQQEVKEALLKLMSVIGIITGAALLLLIVACIGGPKGSSSK
jgi:hypothetical protein